ncbi:MAG: ChaN family lipoprotein [Thermodesulfobacteriota bacterium]
MAKFRDALIEISRKNYRRNLQVLRNSLAYNPAIMIYEKEYHRHLSRYQAISGKVELMKRVAGADLVFHGDYHTLRQSQRCVLRILREIQSKRDIILCLEMFHASDQKHIDAFLAGTHSEDEFIRKIDYRHKWPFSWRNWSPIIYFCRDNHIPILGINSMAAEGIKGLRARDRFSARIIAKTLIRYPQHLVYVVDGDFHISPGHLPKEVDQLLTLMDHPVKRLIIYQNAEKLYWKLCRDGLEETDVLKIAEDSYCVMNAMPANKVQSYLNWLEYSEEAYYPVHGEWEDEGFEGRGLTVQEMITSIASILDLDLPSHVLERLSVYYADDLHLMDHLREIPTIRNSMHLIREKIERGEGFLLSYPAEGQENYLIYLPNSNINMAAEEASHFVNAALRGRMTVDLDPFDRFYWNAVTECLGFFGSKFINEKRKAQSENSLRRLLGQIKRGESAENDPEIPAVARYILQHYALQRRNGGRREFEGKFGPVFRQQSMLPVVFSTQLGYILGNKLYYAVKGGHFPLSRIRNCFQERFEEPGSSFEWYLDISHRLKAMKHVSQF